MQAQETPGLPSGSCSRSYPPRLSLRPRQDQSWGGVRVPGQEPSPLPGLAAEQRCVLGPGIGLRLRRGKQPGLGGFSQALLGKLLKVTPTSNKTFSDTKKGSTWPVPGPAWHLNSAIRVLGAQTGHAVLDALLPPRPECREPAMGLWGPLPLLLTRGPN